MLTQVEVELLWQVNFFFAILMTFSFNFPLRKAKKILDFSIMLRQKFLIHKHEFEKKELKFKT